LQQPRAAGSRNACSVFSLASQSSNPRASSRLRIALPLRSGIRDALRGQANKLREIFEFSLNYDPRRREEIGPSTARLGIQEDINPGLRVAAVEWACRILYPHQASVLPQV
jgi:hypothetical protein